ncbi:glycosyltransferase [Carboxylicivirga sp. N1Y90]|uniref:glycosyltransferase n=1 Tax=Carboxylicivirga fragile TaxID=3417571 RepID=UPI003D349D34|nr:glycosyltransferase [Marinilabiliaceae bacterium N1Y90]
MVSNKDVTLVITSCDRLHLLKRTIDSFEKYNTYPIKDRIIIEDSGKEKVKKELISLYGDHYKIIFNDKPLKQIKSIDRAYAEVKTEYIFHCEDDWEFYRPNFIEDSLKILEGRSQVKQVGLRSIEHDIKIHHPSIKVFPNSFCVENIRYYKFEMIEEFKEYDWITCSFNPGLLRTKDYKLIETYASKASTEGGISLWYKNQGYYGITLENDAVKHIGWEESSMGHYQEHYNFGVRFKNCFKSILNLLGFNLKYN